MAISFCSLSVVSAKDGGSAVGLSSYVGRQAMTDEYNANGYDFSHKEADLIQSGMVLPEGAPERFQDAQTFWNEAQQAETRKDGFYRVNAQLAYHQVLALPDDPQVTDAQRVEMAQNFAREQWSSKGVPVQVAVHSGEDGHNSHAHLLVCTRRMEGEEIGAKARDLAPQFRRGYMVEQSHWNQRWEDFQNSYFESHGLDITVDPPGLVPQLHEGKAHHMGLKGIETEIKAENAQRFAEAQEAARDPELVLSAVTRNRSTFTERDVDTVLKKSGLDVAEHGEIKRQVFEHADVLPLYERETGEASGRYTLQQVRYQEQDVMDRAAHRAQAQEYGISESAARRAVEGRTMDPEQLAAFEHATSSSGLAVIEGRAGAGKSYTMGAVREAYAESGYRVVGLAPTNTVARDMAQDGFGEASTLHSALWFQEHGHGKQWDGKTVLIVDEAGMVDTGVYDRLTLEADKAGAKLVIVGDDRQLSSVQRGGMFAEIKEEHGSAIIQNVRRQSEEWQRQASQNFADGHTFRAVKAYQDHGRIKWSANEAEQRAALVEQWKQDYAADPERNRFVYAATNAQVNELNAELRAIRVQNGEIEDGQAFETCKGSQQFAAGDRIQFHATDKRQGIMNGALGTVEAIEGDKFSVKTDQGERVSFNAQEFDGFAQGYAGTVYRGQGKTQADVYAMHGAAWDNRTSYVAMTRHQDNVHLYVNQEKTKDLVALSRQMRREQENASSLQYLTEAEAAQLRQQKAAQYTLSEGEEQESSAAELHELDEIPEQDLEELGEQDLEELDEQEEQSAEESAEGVEEGEEDEQGRKLTQEEQEEPQESEEAEQKAEEKDEQGHGQGEEEDSQAKDQKAEEKEEEGHGQDEGEGEKNEQGHDLTPEELAAARTEYIGQLEAQRKTELEEQKEAQGKALGEAQAEADSLSKERKWLGLGGVKNAEGLQEAQAESARLKAELSSTAAGLQQLEKHPGEWASAEIKNDLSHEEKIKQLALDRRQEAHHAGEQTGEVSYFEQLKRQREERMQQEYKNGEASKSFAEMKAERYGQKQDEGRGREIEREGPSWVSRKDLQEANDINAGRVSWEELQARYAEKHGLERPEAEAQQQGEGQGQGKSYAERKAERQAQQQGEGQGQGKSYAERKAERQAQQQDEGQGQGKSYAERKAERQAQQQQNKDKQQKQEQKHANYLGY